MNPEAAGNLISKYRLKAGLTQEALAKYIDTSPQNIYKYEKGIITNIPLNKLEAIANVLGVSPSVLAGWEPDPEADEPPSIWAEVYTTYMRLDPEERENMGHVVLGVLRSDIVPSYNYEDHRLIYAWHRASPDDQNVVTAALRKYGFRSNI